MKIEKFKVLLYLKKSGLDKTGKAPIMGRITVNRTMAQFSCKLSCTPSLWNPRASRLEGKSKEAVETNKDIEQLLLSIQKAFDVLVEKRTDFEAKDVKEALQGSVKTQTTLLSFVDEHISELSTHEGIDMSKSSVWTYRKIRKNLAEFIGEKYRLTDLAFGQLTEPFISDFHHYLLDEKGFSSGTITIYVSLFKKMCRHTFGVLMLNEDIPIGSIAKMMGHADITSTQVYAQVTEQKISNDMDKLIAKRERNRLSNEKTIPAGFFGSVAAWQKLLVRHEVLTAKHGAVVHHGTFKIVNHSVEVVHDVVHPLAVSCHYFIAHSCLVLLLILTLLGLLAALD